MLFPINFAIPEEKICKDNNPIKTKIMSSLIPDDFSTYIYNNETDYYNEYKKSYFATTTKKSGWDCMRHYEILANGCIPYFIDIEKCPINTMTLLPKKKIIESNAFYNRIKNKNKLNEEDIYQYKILKDELFNYTKMNLTTIHMAKYILKKTNFNDVKKILYLSGDLYPDYLRCTLLHGFKKLLGDNCHDYPKIPHIYKSNQIDYNSLYGKGISSMPDR